MTHQEAIADRLRQLRRERAVRERQDVNQADVAEAIGVPLVTFGRYENARRKIPTEVISALAEYYGVTTDFLLGKAPSVEYGGKVPNSEARAASRERAAKQADRPTAKKAVGDRKPRGRPKGDR